MYKSCILITDPDHLYGNRPVYLLFYSALGVIYAMTNVRLIKALGLMAAAAICFAVTGGLVKVVTQSMSFLMAVLGRSVIGFFMLFVYFKAKGIPTTAHNHGLLAFRSFLGFVGMSLFFFGIQKIPLSSAVILNFSSPIFVAIFSVFLLKERFHKALPVLIGLSFLGAGLIVSPDFHDINAAAVLALLSAVTTGLAWVLVRRISKLDTAPVIVLFYMGWATMFSMLAFAILAIFGVRGYGINSIIGITRNHVAMWALLGVGIFATLGQIFTTEAYSSERAAVVGVFSYLTPIISYFIGLFFFDESPKLLALIGGILILISSIAVVLLERTTTTMDT